MCNAEARGSWMHLSRAAEWRRKKENWFTTWRVMTEQSSRSGNFSKPAARRSSRSAKSVRRPTDQNCDQHCHGSHGSSWCGSARPGDEIRDCSRETDRCVPGQLRAIGHAGDEASQDNRRRFRAAFFRQTHVERFAAGRKNRSVLWISISR